MQINETQEKQLNLLDKLFTPKQIAERGIISLVTQWKEREKGRLEYYQIGRRILYSEDHINDFLALCESDAQPKTAEKSARKFKNRPANRFGQ